MSLQLQLYVLKGRDRKTKTLAKKWYLIKSLRAKVQANLESLFYAR